jgi:hypothetical protein
MVRVPILEKPALDRAEGLGYGYTEKQVSVVDENGATHALYAYMATDSYIDHSLHPYRWYLDLVIRGAEAHRISAAYLEFLRSTEAVDDPEAVRRAAAQVGCS